MSGFEAGSVLEQSEAPDREQTVEEQQLAAFAGDLGILIGDLEQRFVPFGHDLCALIDFLKRLMATAEQGLAATREHLTGRALAEVKTQADEVIGFLKRQLVEMRDANSSLQEVNREIVRLRTLQKHIHRVASFLSACGTKFAIESARHLNTWPAAAVFVEELRGLAAQIGEVAVKIDTDTAATHAQLTTATGLMSRSLTELDPLAGAMRSGLWAVAEEVEGLVAETLRATNQIAASRQMIGEEADRLVYFLQFGDLIRQKCEHVAAAVDDICSQYRGETDGAEEGSIVTPVLRTQIAQLELIQTEVADARANLAVGYDRLGKELSTLAECGQTLQDDRTRSIATGSPWTRMKASLLELERIHGLGTSVNQKAHEAAADAGTAAAILQRHSRELQQVGERLHILALNAIIQTARLGRGCETMGELARQVELLHRECNDVRVEVLAVRKKVGERVARLTPSEESVGTVSFDGNTHWDSVQEATSTLSGQILTASHQGRSLLDGIQSRLETLDVLAQDIDRFRADLAAVVATRVQRTGESEAYDEAMSQTLLQRYTMESEREIHRKMLSGGGAPLAATGTLEPSTAAAQPSEPKPADDLGDNIELF